MKTSLYYTKPGQSKGGPISGKFLKTVQAKWCPHCNERFIRKAGETHAFFNQKVFCCESHRHAYYRAKERMRKAGS